MNIIKEPRVTLICKPDFIEAPHLHVHWNPIDAYDPNTQSASAQIIEYAGRLCYMSQSNPADKTTIEYLRNILEQAHGSVLEHANISLLIEGISRSCSHEIVRHRAGFAYSQLSQRYVDESDVDFVMPPAIMELDSIQQESWRDCINTALAYYQEYSELLYDLYSSIGDTRFVLDKRERRKKAREAARSVLPNATETKIVMTGNVRAWRHFLQMRGSLGAEAEIRRLSFAILLILFDVCPEGFQDMRVVASGYPLEKYIESEYIKV